MVQYKWFPSGGGWKEQKECIAPVELQTGSGTIRITAEGSIHLPQTADCQLYSLRENATMYNLTAREIALEPGYGVVIKLEGIGVLQVSRPAEPNGKPTEPR